MAVEYPFNKEVETELLAIMINFPRTIPYVMRKVPQSMFYLQIHQNAYRAMIYSHNVSGEKMDPLMVTEQYKKMFEDRNDAEIVVGEILHGGMSDARVDWYIEKVQEYAARRKLIKMSQYTQKHANDLTFDIIDLTSRLQSGIDLIRGVHATEVSLADDIDMLDATIGNKNATVPFGLPILDRKLAGYMRNDITTVGGRTSHGKAQPLTSKILTPTGWTTMGNIKTNEDIIGSNGKTYQVSGVYPQGLKRVYQVVFSDGAVVECCKDHLWEVKTADIRKHKDMDGIVIKTSKMIGNELTSYERPGFSVEFVNPVEFNESNLELHPYVLGVILGDGGISQPGIKIFNECEDIISNIENLLPDDVIIKWNGWDHVTYSIIGKVHRKNSVIEFLKKEGLYGKISGTKFVPSKYIYSSITQRIELLRGLMDTDGHVHIDKRHDSSHYYYYSKSPMLADAVVEIVKSLGGKATKFERPIKSEMYYDVYIRFGNGIVPVSSKKHLDKVIPLKLKRRRYVKEIIKTERIEKQQCISTNIPNQLYITDDYIPTHNTTLAIDTIKRQLDLGYSTSVVTNEMTKQLYLQKLALNIAGVEYQRVIKFGDITDDETVKFKRATQYMRDNYIGKLKVYEFIANIGQITSLIQTDKPDIFWLDWLQRIPLVPGVHDSKEWIKITYGEIARTVPKSNTAAVIISQLSTRKAQSRGNKRPELFDFDDSSFIEKASCDCHLLYWYYNDTMDKNFMTIAELIAAKNRFGEPSMALLSHDPRFGRYNDTSLIPAEKRNAYLQETGIVYQ